MNTKAYDFLARHGMLPERVDPAACAPQMAETLEYGLRVHGARVPMIPTYLTNDGAVAAGESAVVIDAGGTNFRCALVTFTGDGYRVDDTVKRPMPGIKSPATWEEFISFVADNITPLMDRADCIGFCFSYSADITPEIDGIVNCIDKEVVITGCEGKPVGASLIAELERRGIVGKRVVILNDTVAVLLGGSALEDKSRYSGFIGQVSGTGTNTCCTLPMNRIKKLNRDEAGSIIVNLESGMYDGIAAGDFDRALDAASNNPGSKQFEKLTAGVYLGELVRRMLNAAADEGLLSEKTAASVRRLAWIDSAVIDGWSAGEKLEEIAAEEEDADFIRTLSQAMFERSARCMCTNLAAIILLTGDGTHKDKPVFVCAEGSLVQHSRCYRSMLEELMEENITGKLGRYAVLKIQDGATMPGSAAAALLNRKK